MAFFSPYIKRFESIFLVNDGSSDNTLSVLNMIARQIVNAGGVAYVLTSDTNLGKGSAVRAGMLQAARLSKADYVGVMDADESTPVSEILRLGQVARQKQIPIVQGARVALSGKNISRFAIRHYFGRVAATLISGLLKIKVYDTQAGAKVFKRSIVPELFEQPFISRWLFDCEVFLRAKKVGYRVYEEPLLVWQHVGTDSAINIASYFKSFIDLLRIKFQK